MFDSSAQNLAVLAACAVNQKRVIFLFVQKEGVEGVNWELAEFLTFSWEILRFLADSWEIFKLLFSWDEHIFSKYTVDITNKLATF